MLILLRHLPDDSALKTAMRDDWDVNTQISAATVTELRAMRGDLSAIFRHESMPFQPVLSPGAMRERDEKRKLTRRMHDDIVAQLRGKT